MPRLFELQKHDPTTEQLALIDLDKVCVIHIEKEPGHHYERLFVRFVDGHEAQDLVPADAAQPFLDAFREYLREQSAGS